MATKTLTKPVQDSVAKVNDEVAVGEDLDFQRKWWRFENAAWVFFTLIIILDLCGLFGRGPIAKAERHTADGTVDVKYERIERTDSPSILSISFGQSAIQDGKIRLYVSNSLVKPLGTQRVIPAPKETSHRGRRTHLYLPCYQTAGQRRSCTAAFRPGHLRLHRRRRRC